MLVSHMDFNIRCANRYWVLVFGLDMEIDFWCWCKCRICISIFGGVSVSYGYQKLVLVLVSDLDIDIWCWCLCRICKSILDVCVTVMC